MKFKVSHVLNFLLSAFALGLFALNLRTELAGEHFDLRTGDGATILTVFLVAGVVVQLGKLAQGHENAFELTITLLLLGAHVVGDVYIWYRTQIQDLALPAEIPFLIIGGYWLIGVIDFASMYLPAQLKLYSKTYVSPQHRISELESELKLALQAHKFAEQAQSDRTATAKQLNYIAVCPHCAQEFAKESDRALQNAMNAHLRWCPSKTKALTPSNGHGAVIPEMVERGG